MLFHHCIALEDVCYGIIVPSEAQTRIHIDSIYDGDPPDVIESFIGPNLWLEKQVGFYPLFMAAGSTLEDIGMTGYGRQWIVVTGSRYDNTTKQRFNTRRKKGEFPNKVLFSYKNVKGVFVDYDYWFITLNSGYSNYEVGPGHTRWILKTSWNKARWLRKARKRTCSVMYVVPQLDLRQANRIWVRNERTRKLLVNMGFINVQIKRIPSYIKGTKNA